MSLTQYKELKIALDFDSVLADTMVAWTQKCNNHKGTAYTKSDIESWHFWDDLGIPEDYAFKIFDECWSDWKCLPPTEDNLNSKVEQLQRHGRVTVVTEVKRIYNKNIERWLDAQNISCEIDHSEGNKAQLNYDVFIDDKPSFATDVTANEKYCLLYDQQWNRKVPSGNKIIRVKTLTDALAAINTELT